MPSATPSRLSLFAAILALVGSWGCGSSKKAPVSPPQVVDGGQTMNPPPSDVDAGTPQPTIPCDAPTIANCFAAQMACSTSGGSAQCTSCPSGQYATSAGACETISGTPISHDFAAFTTGPGQELIGSCQSWTLNNPTELWVNAVELNQDAASHHSNWTFSPDDKYVGPDGTWRCSDRAWDEINSARAGGVLYAQSTQAKHEVQKFRAGAAIRIPPYSRIISDVHILNATRSAVTGHYNITLYTLPVSDVTVKLVPFNLTIMDLNIPPHLVSRFSGDCDLDSGFTSAGGTGGFDTKIHFILPHAHTLASRFFVKMRGGPMDGSTLFEIGSFNAQAHGRAYDPPISTQGATGIEFGCEFRNDRDAFVHWGYGDQEMCELLGFAESKFAFVGGVTHSSYGGVDNNVSQFSGPCDQQLVFPWNFSSPGGPGPM